MTKEEKLQLVREQLTSGLTQAEFCKLKSITLSSFQYWKANRRLGTTPSFVEIVPKQQSIVPITITAGRFRIDVPAGFDKRHLSAILESLPC